MTYWSNITIACVFYVLQLAHADTTHASKACYGSAGAPCTVHQISCNNTKQIYIEDAYYTNNTECKQGLSNCISVKPDMAIEHGYHKFNQTEMTTLGSNCTKMISCIFHSPRRSVASVHLVFSVVQYQCLYGPNSYGSTTKSTSTSTMAGGSHTSSVVGGVVTTILVLIVITLTLVWYLRKRRRKTDQSEKTITSSKDVKTDFTYSLAGNSPQSHYHEIDELKTNSRSHDYDYATADGIAIAPNKNNYFTIEPVTKPNTNQNSAPSAMEDDYDHIGDKPSALTSNYDTTASVAQSAGTGTHPREDDYGYNLLQTETNTKTVHNDYDTTASAAKAVARLHGSNKTDENDYDHFP